MSATFAWKEDNGAATGSPSHGTSRTSSRTEQNYKATDDSTTAYSSSPITAGNNSYEKFQYGVFSGSFNSVFAGLWTHTAGALGTGLTLKGVVTSTYTTPAAATNAALTVDMTSVLAIASGQTVLFSTTGPEAASPGATLSAAGYSQYLVTQLQTSTSAAAGDTATTTVTLQYSEN